jgi:photosystem II stability/assembly factor-like uncharacterized protein
MKTFLISLLMVFVLSYSSYCQQGWYSINTGISSHFHDIQFTSQNTGYIVGWSSKILKTTNSGDNWVQLSQGFTGDFQSVYFINDNTGWVIGGAGVIIKTTDGGLSWVSQYSGTSSILYSISFIDVNNGFIVGDGGYIRKTTNSGGTWVAQSLGTSAALTSIKFVDTNTGFIVGDGGRIYKTTNSGLSWYALQSGVSNNIGKAFFLNLNTGWVPGTNGIILKTTNGGTNWSINNSPSINWNMACYFVDANTGWVAGENGVIIKSTDGGITWSSQITGTTNNFRSNFFLNSNTGFAVGFNSTLLKTTNGGIGALSTPVLVSPANYSLNLPLTPTLVWNSVANATSYTYQVSTTSIFNNIVDSGTITSTQKTIASGKLNQAYTYFWRVCAKNSSETSNWSTVWYFSTTAGPNAPLLISPTHLSTNIPLTPTLTWTTVSGATTYLVQISSNSSFTTIIDSITSPSNQRIVPSGKLNLSSTYYWRVRANNSITYGPWSEVWIFNTAGLPEVPALVSPPNGALAVVKTPLMNWNDASNATSYTIQISTVSNFIVMSDSATVTASQYQVPTGKLFDWVTYFWRVRSNNNYGTSNWSTVWMFTVYPNGISSLGADIPKDYKLHGNYPNPFNPSTKIQFDVPKASDVKLIIYDASGREIERMYDGGMPAGKFVFTWNASKYSSGIYFARLITKEYSDIKRMILLK